MQKMPKCRRARVRTLGALGALSVPGAGTMSGVGGCGGCCRWTGLGSWPRFRSILFLEPRRLLSSRGEGFGGNASGAAAGSARLGNKLAYHLRGIDAAILAVGQDSVCRCCSPGACTGGGFKCVVVASFFMESAMPSCA